jgi:hypothetical protein
MADFVDRIKLIVDMTTDGASKGIGDIKSKVGEADGAFGKLKAGAGSAFNFLQANAGLSATAAAGAIVAFGKQSISTFQDLALSVEDFATTAGTSAEEASRLVEVSGDLGLKSDDVAAAMARLNREAASGTLSQFGITADDANERLVQTLEYISKIPNEADRSKAAFDLFGKSASNLSPLIANVGTLRDRLAEVSGSKLIDEKAIADAREFADMTDNLNDQLDMLKLSLGKELVGAFNDVGEAFQNLTDLIPGLDGGLGGIISKVTEIATSPLRNIADGFNTITDSTTSLTDKARGFGQMVAGSIPGPLGSWAGNLLDVETAQDATKAATDAATQSAKDQAEAAKAAADALNELLTATLSQFNSQLALADAGDKTAKSINDYRDASDKAAQSNWSNKDATDKVATSMNDAEQAALKQAAAAAKLQEDNAKLNGTQWDAADSASAQANVLRTLAGTLDANDPLRKNLLAYADQLERIPPTKSTSIHADTSQAEATVQSYLNNVLDKLPKFLTTNIRVNAQTTTSAAPAASTSAAPGAVVPLGAAAPASSGTVNNIYVSVSAAPLTHPAEVGRQVADYLDAFYRRSGTRLRAVP